MGVNAGEFWICKLVASTYTGRSGAILFQFFTKPVISPSKLTVEEREVSHCKMRPMGWVAVAVSPSLSSLDGIILPWRWLWHHYHLARSLASFLSCDPRQFYGVLGLGDGGGYYKMGLASTPIGTAVDIGHRTAWFQLSYYQNIT